MTNWTLPDRCAAVDRLGRRCTQPVAHSFDHVPEDVPGIAPGTSAPTNWLAVAAAVCVLLVAAVVIAAVFR